MNGYFGVNALFPLNRLSAFLKISREKAKLWTAAIVFALLLFPSVRAAGQTSNPTTEEGPQSDTPSSLELRRKEKSPTTQKAKENQKKVKGKTKLLRVELSLHSERGERSRTLRELEKKVVVFKLKNGMTFLLLRRTFSPTFSAYIRVKVGGVDEVNGYTGIAHIFEHMAFKGTSVVGTKNWPAERKLLKKLNHLGEALSTALVESRGKETPLIRFLRRKLTQLQNRHRALTRHNEFSKIYEKNGGTGLNATTDKDLTSYFIDLPANRLKLWALQEAARLYAPVFREFYRERSVVAEERRMGISRGEYVLYEKFMATAFLAHPYRFPTVGWESDINAIPLAKVKEFYKKYYVPSNMVGAIVGAIDIEETKKILKQTFGLLPPGPPPPPVRTVEPPQNGERRITVYHYSHPKIMIGFHKPTAPHADDDAFDLIQALLCEGRLSRLHNALVKTGKARKVWCQSLPGARFPNLFTIGAEPIAPTTLKELEKIILAELEKLKEKEVSTKELERVRNKVAVDTLRIIRSNRGLAGQLSYFYAILGDWKYPLRVEERLAKVTPEKIRAVARKYFTASNRTVGYQLKEMSPPGATTVQKLPTFGRRRQNIDERSVREDGDVLREFFALLNRIKPVEPTVRELPPALALHPSNLTFPPLKFTPPKPIVQKLKNGIGLYTLSDREVPLVEMFAIVRTGRLYDPINSVGLAELAGWTLCRGGYGEVGPEELDRALESRAARLSCSVDRDVGIISLSVHRKDLEWGIKLLRGLIKSPRYDEKKVELGKKQLLEAARRRLDNPSTVGMLYLRRALFGPKSRRARYPTPKTIKNLNREALLKFHRQFFQPQNIKLVVAGDFEGGELVELANEFFGKLEPSKVPSPTSVPSMPERVKKTLVLVSAPFPQTLILASNLALPRNHPQWIAAKTANFILGEAGMASVLMERIRTKRGWAYFAGSLIVPDNKKSIFLAYTGVHPFKTVEGTLELVRILQNFSKKSKKIISGERLQFAKEALLNKFIFLFTSSAQIAFRKALMDYYNYPENFLQTFRKKLYSLTLDQLAEAIPLFVKPEELVITVVGRIPPGIEGFFGKDYRILKFNPYEKGRGGDGKE